MGKTTEEMKMAMLMLMETQGDEPSDRDVERELLIQEIKHLLETDPDTKLKMKLFLNYLKYQIKYYPDKSLEDLYKELRHALLPKVKQY
jgi:hypothetical protein